MRTTQPGQSPLLLLDAVAVLRRLGVDYAVIGAMAASFHGVVRGSADADAVISLAARSLGSVEQELQAAGFQVEVRRGGPSDPIPVLLVLSDAHGNRVDLLVGLRGLDPSAFARSVAVPFEGDEIRMIGLEDFIAMKVFAGGPQDLEDARGALAVSGESLNRALVEQLSARYGSEPLERLKELLRGPLTEADHMA